VNPDHYPRPSSVLILHGWQNHRPAGHWQHLLAVDLREQGVEVRYPQLPSPDEPSWNAWRTTVLDELGALTGTAPVLIAHSLAVWVVLDLLADSGLPDIERILLVAPVARATLAANSPIAAFDPGLDDAMIATAAADHGAVHVVCSDDDPYWPGGAAGWAAELGATLHPLSGQGHLALGDGYGRWPAVHDWVLAGGRIFSR
jgi:predicted alpha/beta hydrolase family esterase